MNFKRKVLHSIEDTKCFKICPWSETFQQLFYHEIAATGVNLINRETTARRLFTLNGVVDLKKTENKKQNHNHHFQKLTI